MTEGDFETVLKWNQDPRVLYFADSGRVEPWTLADLRRIYRRISRDARMFIVERNGEPIGEAWLQRMNLPEILRSFPDVDVRRIDLSLGRPELWGKRYGTEVAGALVRWAFQVERVDVLFACDILRTNRRSRRLFRSLGFRPWTDPAAPRRGRSRRTVERRHFWRPRRRFGSRTPSGRTAG